MKQPKGDLWPRAAVETRSAGVESKHAVDRPGRTRSEIGFVRGGLPVGAGALGNAILPVLTNDHKLTNRHGKANGWWIRRRRAPSQQACHNEHNEKRPSSNCQPGAMRTGQWFSDSGDRVHSSAVY